MRYKLCRCGGVKEDHAGAVCPQCKTGAKKNRRTTTEYGYDKQWQRLSVRVRTEQPLCEVCLKKEMVTPATEVHHIVPIDDAPWLRLERSNLMSLCNTCHNSIHAMAGAKVAPGGG